MAAIMGLAIIPLFAVVGLAIDTGRGYMLKSKLSYAIDAAGLAGGRAFDTDHRRRRHPDVLRGQFSDRLHELGAAARSPVINDAKNTITIEAYGDLRRIS